MDERVDCLVIGAGVVGLAVARALARAGREVVVVEATEQIGSEASSRNSEAIHAGIYYPKDSLKARLCVAGKAALYRFCAEYGVAHARTGKLIVAADEAQVPALGELKARAAANGVDDLELLGPAEVARLEPEVSCAAALLSPSTGIVDGHGLMLALLGEAEAHGAAIAYFAPFEGASADREGLRARIGGAEPIELVCDVLVNSAGLAAQGLARRIEGLDPATIPPLYFAKGNYFGLRGRAPFRRLVYPVPEPGGLGVHVTLDLGGRCRFGPDVEWIEEIDYDVDPARADAFYGAIRRYWPGLPDGALQPDYAGIRPKLVPEGAPAADFVIQGRREHGLAGLVNLYGIESPGLTAALAIAERVAEMVGEGA